MLGLADRFKADESGDCGLNVERKKRHPISNELYGKSSEKQAEVSQYKGHWKVIKRSSEGLML